MQEEQKVTGWAGWIAFASFMFLFEGILQILYGLAALFNQNWYVSTSSGVYLFNIETWGWISLALGILLVATAAMLQRGSVLGRSLGVLFVVLGVVYNLAFLSVAPFWASLALVVYVLVGYAIIAHGDEMKVLSQA